MKHKDLGQPLSQLKNDDRGFIMIIAVIIISAVLSIILIKTALTALTQLDSSDTLLKGLETQYYAEGCLQEALVQLNRDNEYAGGNLVLGNGTCNISIAGIDNNRTIIIAGTLNGYTHNLEVEATLDPFAVDVWDN